MNAALLTKPATSTQRAPRAARRAIVEVATPERAAFGHAAGRHLVVDDENLAWPEADSGDILDIDFDVREYRGEGQYLVQHVAPSDEVVGAPGRFPFSSGWTKVVRLARTGLHSGIDMLEADGRGMEWRAVPPEKFARFKFLGLVHGIYCRAGRKPYLDFVGKVTGIGEAPDGSALVQFCPGDGRTITVTGLEDDEARRVRDLMLRPARLEIKP